MTARPTVMKWYQNGIVLMVNWSRRYVLIDCAFSHTTGMSEVSDSDQSLRIAVVLGAVTTSCLLVVGCKNTGYHFLRLLLLAFLLGLTPRKSYDKRSNTDGVGTRVEQELWYKSALGSEVRCLPHVSQTMAKSTIIRWKYLWKKRRGSAKAAQLTWRVTKAHAWKRKAHYTKKLVEPTQPNVPFSFKLAPTMAVKVVGEKAIVYT